MKKLVFLLLSVCFCLSAFSQSSYVYCTPIQGNFVQSFSVKKVKGSYYFSVPRLPNKWFPAKARVQVVDTLPDLIVDEYYAFADVNMLVLRCDSTPQKDLQWQFVDSDPDFTIRFARKNESSDMSVAFWPKSKGNPKALRLTTPASTYYVMQE